MKRFFTLLSLGLAAASAVQAQTTLTAAQFATWTPGMDTVQATNGSAANFAPMAGGTKDLSTLLYTSTRSVVYTTVNNPAFPDAEFGYSFVDIIPADAGDIEWNSVQMRAITPNGIMAYGEDIANQVLPIITPGPDDNLTVLEQDMVYSTPRTILKFPATAGTNWSNNYQYSLNVTSTVTVPPQFPFPSWTDTPMTRLTHVMSTDTIVGYGSMRVKTAAGTPSGYVDVLAVRSRITFVDTLLIDGELVDPTVLDGFGITQGAVTESFTVSWYRAGEVTPLLRVYYADNTFGTAGDNEVHTQRLAPTSVGNMPDLNAALLLHPNPANASINIEHFDAGSLQIVDMMGRVILTQELVKGHNKTSISTASLAEGTYGYRFIQNGELASVGKFVVKH